MKRISIIIMIILLLFVSTSMREKRVDKSMIITEDTRDLQFVNEWVKVNIQDCKRADLKRFTQSLWTTRILTLVVKKCRQMDIPPSVVLSQMFIESRHGSESRISDFSRATNNYFGIKYKNFKEVQTGMYCAKSKKFVNRKTHKVHRQCIRSFSTFKNFDDCLTAYFSIVTRYRDNGNWHVWKTKMARSYATNPNYLKLINTVVKVNHLSDFDKYLKREI